MEFDNSFDVPHAAGAGVVGADGHSSHRPVHAGRRADRNRRSAEFRRKDFSAAWAGGAGVCGTRADRQSIDETNHSARVKAQGNDAKGRGSANATAAFRIEPAGAGSKVLIHTDLMLSGAVAQYGRGVGMIQATAAQIIGQFASNLRAQFGQQAPAPAPAAARPAPEPVVTAPQPEPAPAAQAAPRVPAPPLPPAIPLRHRRPNRSAAFL